MEVKLPIYNALNMLLTGLVFTGEVMLLFPTWIASILKMEPINFLILEAKPLVTCFAFAGCYEIGLVINRIGSITVEGLLRRFKLIPFNNDYKRFNDVKKKYPILEILSREYALSRTGIALFVILSIISIFSIHKIFVLINIAIAVVYFLSCRKHSQKICDSMRE